MLRLWGKALQCSSLECGGQVVVALVEPEDLVTFFSEPDVAAKDSGYTRLANFLLNTWGTKCAVLLRPGFSNNSTYVSFRSQPGSGISVRQVAEKFGGGGHDDAAGAEIPGQPSQVRHIVVNALSALLASVKEA